MVSFNFKEKLTKEERKKKYLDSDYASILTHKQDKLEKTLEEGISSFHDVDLSKSAKKFRKIANDLKKMEFLISHEGNYSDRNKLNDLTGKQWLRHTKSWVIFDGKPNNMAEEIKDHPASFPPALTEYFIEFFTKQRGWVLDPFMGIGSTAEAAFITGRNCIGLELNPKYANFTRKRIKKLKQERKEFKKENNSSERKKPKIRIFQQDSREISARLEESRKRDPNFELDFLITSPPYWDILKKSRGGVKSTQKKRIEKGYDETYGDSPKDLGNIANYENYLSELHDIFQQIKPYMKKRAYLMIIIQNIRKKDGEMLPIAWDLGKRISDVFLLQQEFIWCQNQKFMGIWGYPTTYVSNLHHHYCLVFRNT